MKKVLSILLMFILTFIISGCALTETETEEYPIFCGAGTVLVGDRCVPESTTITTSDVDNETEYSYDISNLPEYFLDYLGETSYTHISEWFETDYNLDGDYSDEELEMSYQEMLEWFDEDHIVTLKSEDLGNMEWCINENMSDEYIDAAIYAIEYYDGIEWVDTSWVLEDSCSLYRFSFTWIEQFDLYLELYDSYIEQGYTEDLSVEMAFFNATNTIAFNRLNIDYENENYFNFSTTRISFIIEAMRDMEQNELNFIALHEMTHSFGLDDIYDEEFIGYSIMYGRREGQDELIPTLKPFDLYNLYLIYYNEEDTE